MIPLVGNPAAGGGRGEIRLKESAALLGVKGFDCEIYRTEHPGHAIDLVDQLAREGHDRIIVCGGDGTVSEAAQGALRSGKDPAIGIMPAGTGNDFLRDFDISDREHAADRIALGKPRRVDAAKVTTAQGERHFVNVFSTGFGAKAGDTANRRFKWIGKSAYTAGVLFETARLKQTPTRLVLDGEVQEGNITMVAVCNSVHTGGEMKIAPQAFPDDGELDVLILDSLNRRELLRIFPKIFDGSHVREKKVRTARAKVIEIEPETPSPLLLDGEVDWTTPVKIEVMPGAWQILV